MLPNALRIKDEQGRWRAARKDGRAQLTCGPCCGCALWRRLDPCFTPDPDGGIDAAVNKQAGEIPPGDTVWICADSTCTDGTPIVPGIVIRLGSACFTVTGDTDPDPAGTRIPQGTVFECIGSCQECLQFWKMATACCPQGDYADVVFIPASEVCNVVVIVGSCYQVQHGVLFVDCAMISDEQFESLPDNVVCLPDGPYLFYRVGDYGCTTSCQDAVCSPCPPADDCCVGPINNQCGARLPIGGGSTARIHCNVKSSRRYVWDCQGFNVLYDTYTGRDVRDHGNGECSWGGLVTIPGGNRVRGWTDGNLDFDETYDFSINPVISLSGGRPFPERTCAGSGTMATVSPPALDLVFAELECAVKLNGTGNGSFGINGPYPEPNMETVVCRTGIIRGGKCAGILGAWGTLTASHLHGQFETCPGSVERVFVRVFVFMSTSKTAPCGNTSPDDGDLPAPSDPNAAAIESFLASDPTRRCPGCGG